MLGVCVTKVTPGREWGWGDPEPWSAAPREGLPRASGEHYPVLGFCLYPGGL